MANSSLTARKSSEANRKVRRILTLLWSAVLLIAILAPWAYAAGAALFATFLSFAVLDERERVESRRRGA